MYKNYRICVIVPAFNEEDLILKTLNGIPKYVDNIYVINDASTDKTFDLLQRQKQIDGRVEIINHIQNEGLGKCIRDGYLFSKKNEEIDVTAIMDGDNQMHPSDLINILDKLIDENYDYIKGNRLLHRKIAAMPKYRFIGNSVLTILSKFATGYYSIMDPQCAYSAIKNSALKKIPIEKLTRGYGYNADILCMLNIQRYRVADVEVEPVYGSEKSKIILWKYIPKTSWILINLFFRRNWQRYIVLEFHPLILFYMFALLNIIFIIFPLTIRFFLLYFQIGEAPKTTLTILSISILIAFQSILFAIWMDMDYNKKK